MELYDDALLLVGEFSAANIGAKIIGPPEAAALAAAVESRVLWESSPAAVAVFLYVVHELLIFFWRLGSLL